MTKKLIALLLSLVMLTATFAGCGKKADSETPANDQTIGTEGESPSESTGLKTISFNIGQEPTTLDPGLCSGVDGSMVITHLYDGLLREMNHEMVPATAEKYEVSDDGKVYTFHLRDDAMWSDGKPVTAHDFEFAWKRVQDPAVASQYSWIFDSGNIESYRAVDDQTFEVTLSAPSPVFLTLLGNATFMPLREDIIDYLDGGWAVDPKKVVTNGAYYMDSYKAGDKLILKKNEHFYNKDLVNIDQIEALMITDTTTALTAYEAGQVDAIFSVPPAEITRLLNEEPNFQIIEGGTVNYYCFNEAVKPFDDIRVRQAFSYAIDRTAICNDVLKGAHVPAQSLVPGMIYDNEGNVFNEKTGDHGIPTDLSKVEEAQQLLAEAGYPNGEGFPEFEILYNTDETNKATCEALQQMWHDNLGVNCKLVNMESAVFHQTRVAHDFSVCRGGWTGDYADPLTYLEIYMSDTFSNYAGFNSPEFDQLVSEGRVLSGSERFEKFYAAEKILVENYDYMPISYCGDKLLVNNDKIIGWEWLSTGVPSFVYADVVTE